MNGFSITCGHVLYRSLLHFENASQLGVSYLEPMTGILSAKPCVYQLPTSNRDSRAVQTRVRHPERDQRNSPCAEFCTL